MKRRLLRHKFSLWIITALALASCSQDELTEQDTALPDGMYPMTFTAVQVAPENTPQTRVSDNGNTSSWSVGDQIQVTVAQGDATQESVCTLDASGNITEYNPQLYWQNTSDATINAWYSNIEGQNTGTGNTVRLDNQSSGLAYVLKAEETTAKYTDRNIELKFSHQLAKIRVELAGEKAGSVNDVKIESYTSCTNTNGTVSTDGATVGEITMYHLNGTNIYEANVVRGKKIEKFKLNGGSWVNLSATVTPEKAKVHEISITVNQKIPEITGGEITKPGDYIMKGNITESVTLNASGINLTLDNVQSKTDGAPIIIGNNAQVTLNISGTANSLTSTNGNGIEIREGASLLITGNGMNSSKLVVNASDNTNPDTELKAGIGPSTGNVSIKMINISNVHLVVSGGRTGNNGNGPAAIGLCSVNGTYNQSCEGISITDSKIEATSYGGACIGTGSVSNDRYTGGEYKLGPITITSSQIIATANSDSGWGHSGACIGFGYIGSDANGVIENITITKSTLKLTVGNNNAYKIGRGDIENNATYSITNGIIVDGQNKGNEGWNP